MAIQSDLVIKGLIDIALKGDGSKQAVDSLRRIIAETEKLDAEQKKQLQTAKASEVIERAKAKTVHESVNQQVRDAKRLEEAKKREERAAREAANAQIRSNQQMLASARQLYAFFATGALVSFLKTSLTEYAKTERALNSVTSQIRALGGAAAAEGEKVREFINELARSSGLLDDELIPALNTAVLRFGDYAAAQEAVTIAARFAANGQGDLQSNVEALASFMQTGGAKSLQRFGVTLKEAADGTVDTAAAVAALRAQFEALPSGLDDAQARVLRFGQVWSNTMNAAGKATNGFINMIDAVLKKSLILSTILDPFGALNKPGAGKFEVKVPKEGEVDSFLRVLQKAEDERNKQRGTDQRIANEREAATAEVEARIAIEKEGSEARQKIERELLALKHTYAIQDAQKTGADVAAVNRSFAAQEVSLLEQQRKERAKVGQAVVDANKAYYAELRAAEEEHQQKLLQIQIDASMEGSQERFDLEKKLRQRITAAALQGLEAESAERRRIIIQSTMTEAAIAIEFARKQNEELLKSAVALGDAEAELKAALLEEELAGVAEGSRLHFEILRDQLTLETDMKLEALQRERAMYESAESQRKIGKARTSLEIQRIEAQITAAHVRESAERKKIDEAEQKSRRLGMLDAAAAWIEVAYEVFGEMKAIRIAEAIINTARAVTEALPNIPLAAAVAALGAIQVMKIMSTRPGSGGAESGLLGGGSAAIPAPPPPVSQGQQAAAGGTINNVTNNQATTQNVSMGYPVRNKIEARRMARRLNRLGTADPKRAW